MKLRWESTALAGALFASGLLAGAAEPAFKRETGTLRGFGKIAFETRQEQQLSTSVFRCESPEKAKITGSKYLADQLAYGAVKQLETPAGLTGTLLEVRHGGVWLLGLSGKEFRVYQAPNAAVLQAAKLPKLETIPSGSYPNYLDNFDKDGLGLWWMATTKSPEQLAWMKKFPAIVNLHDQRLDNSPAWGVYDLSGVDNSLSQVRTLGKNYRHMLWTAAGDTAWFGNLVTFPAESIDHNVPGFTGRRYFEAGGYGASQASSPLVNSLYIHNMAETMKRRMDDPRILAWMEPHGEFHLTDPVAYPPNCMTRFPEYLKTDKKYSLRDLNTRYGTRYKNYTEVPFPDTAYFGGRRGEFIDMDSTPWRWQTGELGKGEASGFQKPDFDDSKWFEALRTNKHLLVYFDQSTRVSELWGRGTVDVPEKFLADKKPVWCYMMPYTEHAGRPITLWMNGEEAGREKFDPTNYINKNTAVEVTKFLKPGKNQFAIHNKGGRIAYRVFLSKCPPQEFPFADAKLNAFYLDWRDYLIREKYLTFELFMKALRAADPNRPFKVMTPHLFQSDAMDLLADYGGYPQLTGEGGWYRPMHYKGYSSLRGLPGSSEPGGAQKTAASTQMMFAVMFWESQDCHDYVFDLNRELWQHKEALQWWSDHADFLATLGKVDLAAPQVAVLRDVRQTERYQNSGIWNWDMSRGSLPSLGLTPVLVDGPDLMKKLADHLPLLLDCATTVMEPQMVDAVKRYIEKGGTFIAQHHTGQHSDLVRDAWPLAKAFGLKVTPKWVTLENYHRWPLETIRFTAEQDMIPSLKGKSIQGSGVSIDYLDNQRTGGVQISGQKATPIAHWEDGSIAIAEVKYGKGRLILLGSPFYLRMKDVNGQWSNDAIRQKYVAEMLASCGVKRETSVADQSVWFERRESKNGLYDVYFAGAMGVHGKWDLSQRIKTTLDTVRAGQLPAVAADTAGAPDVATVAKDGKLSFGEQEFSPFQIRQFAVVREDAGRRAPSHWLAVQEKAWRELKKVDSSILVDAEKMAKAHAVSLGEEGLDLSEGWEIKVDDDTVWQPGRMGSWSAIGKNDAKRIVYRKTVTLPATWTKDARVTLGMVGYWQLGMQGDCKLTMNGKPFTGRVQGNFSFDISDVAKEGKIAFEFDVTGPKPGPFVTRGPAGTLFLRRTPAPTAVIPLDGEFEVFTKWATKEDFRKVKFPCDVKAVGLRTRIVIPEQYANRPIRLVIEHTEPGNRHASIAGVLINGEKYFRPENYYPVGPRIDHLVNVGKENVLELLTVDHLAGNANMAKVKSARLEVF